MRKMFFILLILFLGCSQGNKDLFGTITDNAGLYQRDGRPITDTSPSYVKVGTRVMLIDKDGCKKGVNDEEMVVVMFPNVANDFVKGYQCCIPKRKIKWD